MFLMFEFDNYNDLLQVKFDPKESENLHGFCLFLKERNDPIFSNLVSIREDK